MNWTYGPSAPNGGTIDILNDEHVEFWTSHLSVTEIELRNAVFIAGPLIKDVKDYLVRKGKLAE